MKPIIDKDFGIWLDPAEQKPYQKHEKSEYNYENDFDRKKGYFPINRKEKL